MYSFRAFIRRILGVSLPSETVDTDAVIIADLRSALAEAECEVEIQRIQLLVSAAISDLQKQTMVDALVTLMTGLGLDSVELTDEDESLLEGYDTDVDCG